MYLAETDDRAVDSDTERLINAASLLKKSNGCLASKSHYLLDREMVIEKHDWNESNFTDRKSRARGTTCNGMWPPRELQDVV